MARFSGNSSPFPRMALSNWIAMADSASPFARAEACVTSPTRFVPFGRITLPSDLAASVVFALTRSPGLLFLESTGALNRALNDVPLDSTAPDESACADVDDQAPPDACACLVPVCVELWVALCVPACASVCDRAEALTAKTVPTIKEIPVRIIMRVPPPEQRLSWPETGPAGRVTPVTETRLWIGFSRLHVV